MDANTGGVFNLSIMENIGVHFTEDYIEIGYLTVIIFFGLVLNTGVFVQLMRQSRTPTASTSFLTGPYQLSSFNLFKVHLCITDFGILLVHALGKLIWIYTLEWHMGGYYGCKAYQFLSAFTYYANSNVVVSIGLDRLKVVYTSHIQGATSVRRVRWMLAFSWTIAAICSLPQLYVWETIIFTNGTYTFQQCTTIWQIASHLDQSNELIHATQVFYEACHEAVVFWIPFFTLLGSYLLIVVRVLHYTLHPISSSTSASSIRRTPARCQAASEGRLLISSFDNLPTDYYSAYLGNATEMTMLSTRGESTHSSPKVSVKSGNNGTTSVTVLAPDEPQSKRFRLFRCGCWKRFQRNCDCLLSGKEFSERIIERKVVCCGTSRACCLNAETAGPKFRPLGVRTPPSGSPVWRRQLRSRIFITSLAIVTCHFILWLPYNMVNMLRFIHDGMHAWLANRGAHLLEDLIVLNSVLNPILYAYEPR